MSFEKFIDKYTASETNKYFARIDHNINLCLKPKPKWMPRKVYDELIKNLLYIEEFNNYTGVIPEEKK